MLNDDREKMSAVRLAQKEARAHDAASARREYEAEKGAVLAKTERLRALRLAKEASDAKQKATAGKRPGTKRVAKRAG